MSHTLMCYMNDGFESIVAGAEAPRATITVSPQPYYPPPPPYYPPARPREPMEPLTAALFLGGFGLLCGGIIYFSVIPAWRSLRCFSANGAEHGRLPARAGEPSGVLRPRVLPVRASGHVGVGHVVASGT